MKLTKLRMRSGRWCEVEITMENGRLSISGSEGRIVSRKAAKIEARKYWESFFEESREELGNMAIRFGTRTPRTAASKALEVDGEFHGLDVAGITETGYIRIVESCGQIRETIAEWFPEVAPYLRYHLNDMHAECEHQEARGETWTTHPEAACPECGYRLGSQWLNRELPADVIAWVNRFAQEAA